MKSASIWQLVIFRKHLRVWMSCYKMKTNAKSKHFETFQWRTTKKYWLSRKINRNAEYAWKLQRYLENNLKNQTQEHQNASTTDGRHQNVASKSKKIKDKKTLDRATAKYQVIENQRTRRYQIVGGKSVSSNDHLNTQHLRWAQRCTCRKVARSPGCWLVNAWDVFPVCYFQRFVEGLVLVDGGLHVKSHYHS